jgi:hypothetical protein
MRNIPVTIHSASAFDSNTAVLIPHDPAHLPALWCYCSSPDYNEAVRRIDQKLNVTNATLAKVPFDLERWTAVAEREYPHGLPAPFSDDPTQWVFHGHPCGSVVWDAESKRLTDGPLRIEANVLHVAVARLLSYRWPAEQDPTLELSTESHEWVARCAELEAHADPEGIVIIPASGGQRSAADRLQDLLAAAYGSQWTAAVLSRLLEAADCKGLTLDRWLRDHFFKQHCQLFGQRPFVWQVWDGLPDGFSVLLNYHRLTREQLKALIYRDLGEWIRRQEADARAEVSGAEGRLAAAKALQQRLELILEGEAPYDIFVRWKPLSEQPIGWDPDLNDGVRLNIRPWLSVPDVKKKGAGVLREKPNIKWDKDRGRDVSSAPWYGVFGGERINDHHLSLSEKRAARDQ